jgi:uncharacterized membrane protein (TIGR02234 family)
VPQQGSRGAARDRRRADASPHLRDAPLSGRRGLLTALVGCVAAGAVVLIAAGREWRHADLTAVTGARISISVTGHSAEPALPALAIALVVLAAAVVAARGWPRRLVGLVVVVIGASIVALAVASRVDAADELRRQASVHAVAHAAVSPSLSAWAIVTVLGGLGAVVAGALTVATGARWPALGSRYEAPAVRRTGDLTADWDALDRGEDPTV